MFSWCLYECLSKHSACDIWPELLTDQTHLWDNCSALSTTLRYLLGTFGASATFLIYLIGSFEASDTLLWQMIRTSVPLTFFETFPWSFRHLWDNYLEIFNSANFNCSFFSQPSNCQKKFCLYVNFSIVYVGNSCPPSAAVTAVCRFKTWLLPKTWSASVCRQKNEREDYSKR